jgi:cyclopropane fatty-acyl-phospholipid synthase-like methyltransferase
VASQAELQWWDKFAGVMAKQWNLTPAMNHAIRAEYERDYENFLFLPGGTLLDVGCGTGVRTHALARRGMEVDGIDFSASQLELARETARRDDVPGMEFFQRDIVNEAWAGRHQRYDAVFVCALLHHLSYDELDRVFDRIAGSVKPGGRVYLYEPLVTRRRSLFGGLAFWVVDVGWRVVLILSRRLAAAVDALDPEMRAAMREGYTGTSPDEHAIEYERLAEAWGQRFQLVEARPFHQYSLGYAMSVMLLADRYRRRFEALARPVYRLEQMLFRLGMWESAGLEKRWILCAVKLRRNVDGAQPCAGA